MTENDIINRLFSLRDEGYGAFQAALVPTVPAERIIGVRLPLLRKLAKELSATPAAALFLEHLPHRYYDEDMLHALMLNGEKDMELLKNRLGAFLPFVDNWAVCDTLMPQSFAKRKEEALELARECLGSPREYTVRFGLRILMSHFLTPETAEEALSLAVRVRREEYYIRMMQAWLYATAFAKCPEQAFRVLEGADIDKEVASMTYRKCRESRRVPPDVCARVKKALGLDLLTKTV